MIARAIARYQKISPKKARLVIDAIRGKSVDTALSMLPNINKKASELIEDVLKSAVSNVKVKYPEENYTDNVLFISKITADEGPSLKRFRAASMGRASMIKKRSSHILVELDIIKEKLEQLKTEKKSQQKKRWKGKALVGKKTKKGSKEKKSEKMTATKGSK